MFLVQKMSGSKHFLVQNNFWPKKFWVQRNFEFKEIWAPKIWLKTELLFRKIAQIFLIIKSNCEVFAK